MLELYEVLGGPSGSQDSARAGKNGVLPLEFASWCRARPRAARLRNGTCWRGGRWFAGQDIRDAHAQQSTQNNSWETNFVLYPGRRQAL